MAWGGVHWDAVKWSGVKWGGVDYDRTGNWSRVGWIK